MDSVDNYEVDVILEILENMKDEELAAQLLKEFNDATRKLGVLILNQDKTLKHEEWKMKCDLAKKEVDRVIGEIRSHSGV